MSMPFAFSRTYRSLLRLKDIATVLTRHGLGHLVDLLNLRQHVPFLQRLAQSALGPNRDAPPVEHLGARLVLAFEDLGPTFIKLGQLLSGRPDILPEAWLPDFRRLQDRVPPFAPAIAREIVEEALGQPIEQAFAAFDDEPIASGSIAQAHLARLTDGREVVVKVRRPDIERQLLTDIDLLTNLAQLAETYVDELRAIQPTTIVAEFAAGLRRELDFVVEATQTAKFHTHLSSIRGLRVPAVHWELTSSRVLVVERLAGANIGDFARLDRLGIDRAALADTLASAFMRQYFELGLFHADPHPGNILVDDQGTIGLIDYGLVGQLTPRLRDHFATAILAMVRGDLELVAQVYVDTGAMHPSTDIEAAKGTLLEMLDKYFSTPLTKVNAGDVYLDLTRVAREHRIVLPRDFVLLAKSLVTVSTLCRELDPTFSLAGAVRPHVWGVVRQKLSPLRWFNMASLQWHNLSTLLMRLPGDAKQLLDRARQGELRQRRHLEGLEPLAASIEHAASRLALAIFLGALIVGSSLMAGAPDTLQLAVAGYVAGAVVGLWLVIDVLRGERRAR